MQRVGESTTLVLFCATVSIPHSITLGQYALYSPHLKRCLNLHRDVPQLSEVVYLLRGLLNLSQELCNLGQVFRDVYSLMHKVTYSFYLGSLIMSEDKNKCILYIEKEI